MLQKPATRRPGRLHVPLHSRGRLCCVFAPSSPSTLRASTARSRASSSTTLPPSWVRRSSASSACPSCSCWPTTPAARCGNTPSWPSGRSRISWTARSWRTASTTPSSRTRRFVWTPASTQERSLGGQEGLRHRDPRGLPQHHLAQDVPDHHEDRGGALPRRVGL